ncbi:MAG: alpha/beta fold hydrolase [Terriglobales bacterium]
MKTIDAHGSCANSDKRHASELVPFRTKIPGHDIFALTCPQIGGKPIVLVHGAIASRRYMIPTAKLLAENFRVLLPDLPGHGNSSKPEHALTVQQQSDVLKSWFEMLGLHRTNILANSYGCQIAAQFARTYPDSVEKLILTDPTGDPQAPGRWTQFFRLMMDGFVEPPFAPLMMFRDIYDMGIRRTFETGDRINQDDIRKNLPFIKAPTLVVRGENDPVAPHRWCEEVAALIPESRLAVIPNAPHSVNSATAPQLTKLVNDFVFD